MHKTAALKLNSPRVVEVRRGVLRSTARPALGIACHVIANVGQGGKIRREHQLTSHGFHAAPFLVLIA